MRNILRMKISWAIVLIVVFITGTGCQEKANIHMEGKTADAIRTPDVSLPAEGPEVSVVTGEPATTSPGKATDGATTAEDKPGAVAVKMQY